MANEEEAPTWRKGRLNETVGGSQMVVRSSTYAAVGRSIENPRWRRWNNKPIRAQKSVKLFQGSKMRLVEGLWHAESCGSVLEGTQSGGK